MFFFFIFVYFCEHAAKDDTRYRHIIYDEIKITSKGNLKQTTLTKIGKKIKSIVHRLHICNLNYIDQVIALVVY